MDLGATIVHVRAKLPTEPAPTGSENVNTWVDGHQDRVGLGCGRRQ